jgi:3-deoxy-D-manno-octulosonic-acid transferase
VNRPTPLPNALDVLYAVLLVLGSPVLAYRLFRTGKWRTDWRGRFGHATPLPPDPRPTVLLHGVSVGEVAAAAPLVDELAREGCRIVVSATTNTGFARARALYGDRHAVVRHPLDFSRAVHRFLDAVRPDAVALMELEVWPNFTRACARRRLPVVVVNGRLSGGSFGGYRRARPFVAPSFRRLLGVAAQTEAYAERFRALGVPAERIVVADSLKWEASLDDDLSERAGRLAREMGVDRDRPLVVAVSTGPDEERMLLRGRPDGVQLMVVPRKPERFEEVAALGPWVRRSEAESARGRGPSDLFLVDTMGEAEVATALGDVVALGRSWNGLGGSNPVPPAALGRPSVVGPDHHNFDEMVAALHDAGALTVAEEPWAGVAPILADEALAERMSGAGPACVRAHAGATERNVALVRQALAARQVEKVSEEQRLRR